MKRVNINMMIFSSLLVFLLAMSGCGSASGEKNDSEASQYEETVLKEESLTQNEERNLKTFTKEELMKYDGKNGNPAYIAVDGKVYDVTNAPNWSTGMHNEVSAGRDLTKEMKNAPHGLSKLEFVKVVGELK